MDNNRQLILEIGKKVLRNYVQNAVGDASMHDSTARMVAHYAHKDGQWDTAGDEKEYRAHKKKSKNRKWGVAMAFKKVGGGAKVMATEQIEPVNEISDDLKRRYAKAAASDGLNKKLEGSHEMYAKGMGKDFNKQGEKKYYKGIDRSAKAKQVQQKLGEDQLDEISVGATDEYYKAADKSVQSGNLSPEKKEKRKNSMALAAMKGALGFHGSDYNPEIRRSKNNPKGFVPASIKENQQHKIGDKVKVTAGPHQNVPHEIIHVFDDGSVNVKPVGLTPKQTRYRLGAAKASPEQIKPIHESSVEDTMHEFKAGKLHSGSKNGPIVKSRKQAIAIALNNKGKK